MSRPGVVLMYLGLAVGALIIVIGVAILVGTAAMFLWPMEPPDPSW